MIDIERGGGDDTDKRRLRVYTLHISAAASMTFYARFNAEILGAPKLMLQSLLNFDISALRAESIDDSNIFAHAYGILIYY